MQQQLVSGARVDQEQQRIVFDTANVRKAVEAIKRRGFAAIYVNRNGFPDRGKGLEEALLELGYIRPPLRSATGDLACIVIAP